MGGNKPLKRPLIKEGGKNDTESRVGQNILIELKLTNMEKMTESIP